MIMAMYLFYHQSGMGLNKIGVNPIERSEAIEKAIYKSYFRQGILLNQNDIEGKLYSFYKRYIWKTIYYKDI